MLRTAKTVIALALAGHASAAPVCASGSLLAGMPSYEERSGTPISPPRTAFSRGSPARKTLIKRRR